jgi:hypothetical protein
MPGDVFIITNNLSSHDSQTTRIWLQDHPRLHQVFIPKGACWLNRAWKAGGGSIDEMPWLGKRLLIHQKLSKLPVLLQNS